MLGHHFVTYHWDRARVETSRKAAIEHVKWKDRTQPARGTNPLFVATTDGYSYREEERVGTVWTVAGAQSAAPNAVDSPPEKTD